MNLTDLFPGRDLPAIEVAGLSCATLHRHTSVAFDAWPRFTCNRRMLDSSPWGRPWYRASRPTRSASADSCSLNGLSVVKSHLP